ncbi:cupredoxin domain-containing protein [Manganibacter manganicus]|uniref:Amicyanin n=1 Tax=Manganibacter manganicus TaxID=1873176 RepID=A0A1V8RKK2_9HYPH|nr:cupredoxin family copper-binding protein [Pseudaminobacter manganicus]OQM73741.1 amicyanin [Pseudaminobacter manganicus]
MMAKHISLIAGVFALASSVLPAHARTIQVTVTGMAFSPASVTASVGDTIEWVNKDPFAHTATVKGAWEVMLPVGKSASKVIKKSGMVDYYCRFHPNMKGRITVTP